jgi:hypothetical protein
MKKYKEILKMAVGNEVEAYEFYGCRGENEGPRMKKTLWNYGRGIRTQGAFEFSQHE